MKSGLEAHVSLVEQLSQSRSSKWKTKQVCALETWMSQSPPLLVFLSWKSKVSEGIWALITTKGTIGPAIQKQPAAQNARILRPASCWWAHCPPRQCQRHGSWCWECVGGVWCGYCPVFSLLHPVSTSFHFFFSPLFSWSMYKYKWNLCSKSLKLAQFVS